MTDTNVQDLPEYANPPVTEVVCGVLFDPIQTLLAPHLGLLWEKFKPEYTTCQEVAPLASVMEHFGAPLSVNLELSDTPPLPRIWFVHTDENRIVQVQRDRFLHNWRKARPDDAYPRYQNVIEMFRERLSGLETFLQENELGKVVPRQYELTYVNEIPRTEGWEVSRDVGKVFPDFAWRLKTDRFLSTPEDINWRTSFLLPTGEGRLHATLRSAMRNKDGQPVFIFELTVRGMGQDSSREAMWRWFDLAREWIVRGFTDLTDQDAQQHIWGRKR